MRYKSIGTASAILATSLMLSTGCALSRRSATSLPNMLFQAVADIATDSLKENFVDLYDLSDANDYREYNLRVAEQRTTWQRENSGATD